jgi:hypothetical protein
VSNLQQQGFRLVDFDPKRMWKNFATFLSDFGISL